MPPVASLILLTDEAAAEPEAEADDEDDEDDEPPQPASISAAAIRHEAKAVNFFFINKFLPLCQRHKLFFMQIIISSAIV